MSVIISKDNFKIIQIDKSTFNIVFDYTTPLLIKSLIKTKLIIGATISDDYKELRFKAHSVKSLQDFQQDKFDKKLSVAEAAKLTETLSRQLQYLIDVESHTILGYAPENIIVINEKTFAYLGSELITKIEENEQVLISSPFSTTDFFVSPELLKIKNLPSYIHFKTSYFSLACLIISTLLSNDQFYFKYLQQQDEATVNPESSGLINCLNSHPIKHTKLYWLLSRCLGEEPERRSIIHL
jgi:serine/threonine protein kinase